jgi:serine/threonine protein kinase
VAGSATEGDGKDDERSTWGFEEGDVLVPGYVAWALLGLGRRFETWVAWCQDRLAPVCIKLPRRDELTSRALDALGREHQAASAMAHPAIPRVFAYDPDAEIPHLIYEFVEGRPLSLVLDEDGPYDAHDVVFLGLQLAAALRHVHRRGFVHLDLKPSNVTMRGDRAILLDFDIALPVGGQRSTTKPRGTGHYMAPEQIRCLPANPSMDIFALGAVLFEAATARRAFAQPTASASLRSGDPAERFPQLSRPLPDLEQLAPQLTPAVAAAVRRLLAVEPADRPETTSDVIRLLEAALPPDTEVLWPPWVTPALLGDPTIARP